MTTTTISGKGCPGWTNERIPFEAEFDRVTPGRCGAAALCMALRSFGLAADQLAVWRALAADRSGGARTFRLGGHARERGLAALVMQVRRPWLFLQECPPGVVLVLNQRRTFLSSGGHFAVVVGVSPEAIWVHDPARGPRQRLTESELELLWRPQVDDTRIAGHVLVALAAPERTDLSCAHCGVSIPDALRCPACGAGLALQPVAALGCVDPACPRRRWQLLFCLECDTALVPKRAESPPPREAPSVLAID